VVNPDLHGDLVAQKAGRRLVGITGVGCIACHNFEGHPSLGIPAMDLTVMTERLQTGWFHNYLVDPQSLRPGTRMPSFWPDRQGGEPGYRGGDTDRQIAALWTFSVPRANRPICRTASFARGWNWWRINRRSSTGISSREWGRGRSRRLSGEGKPRF
jgi:hypothetical protein